MVHGVSQVEGIAALALGSSRTCTWCRKAIEHFAAGGRMGLCIHEAAPIELRNGQ